MTTFSGSKTIRLYRLTLGGVLEQILTFYSSGTVSKTIFLPQMDTYYMEVSGNALGAYQVSVEELATVPPDTYPDTCGDDPPPFELIPDDAPVEGTISTAIDEDWLTFQAQQLHMYDITLTHDDGGNVYYDLFYSDCLTRITYNRKQLTMVAWENDNYNIRVHGGMHYYEIQVADLGLQPDDHGNTAEDATGIFPNGFGYAGSIQYNATFFSDEDWFVFEAPYDSTYDVTLNSQSSTKYVKVYEEQPAGELTQILYMYTGTSKTQQIPVKEQTRYFAQVYSTSPGSYTLAVQAPTVMCGDLAHPFPTYDFNQDCYVNLVDFAMFAVEWLQCSDPNPPCSFNP